MLFVRTQLKSGPDLIFVSVFALLMTVALISFCSTAAWADTVYEQRSPSWEGTGKVYLGREIAPVMGYQGASWLERRSRNQEEASERLVQRLPLQATDTVADIGAGTGYMSLRIAQRLTKGQVLAVDLQPEMVEMLTTRLQKNAIENIHPILGGERSPLLDEQSIDLALMVDVYHELAYPKEMLDAIARSLKPHGKLILAEYKAENPKVRIKPLHKMSQSQVKAELQASGFKYINNLGGLPQQHLLAFEKD